MRFFLASVFLVGAGMVASAAPAVTIQNALKLLPKDQAKNLVRIEAREGDPLPERWYIQVYDPSDENGLREFVVSGKEVVASRPVSQFLTGAKVADVVGAKLVKVDSDDLLKIVQQYVEANHLTVAKINYTMLREAINPAPVWKISCFDDSGKRLGEVVINARNANVVSHEGFETAPGQSGAKPSATPRAGASASPAAASAASASPAEENGAKPAVPVRAAVPVKPKPPASPSATATPKRPLFQRMFGGGKNNNNNEQPQSTPTR